jgi:tetratricopeptide (TPR) repeat protein
MKHKSLTMLILALLAVSTAQGEVSAKKKVIEPVCDSLQLTIQAGDSLMQQYNTFEALRYYQQAFAMKDTLESRTRLAECYYKRANYHQTADLLKTIDAGKLSHEAFRQLALSYQKMGENEAFIFWASNLTTRFPMDGEIVAGLTLAHARANQPEKGIVCGMKYCQRDTTNILVNRALADAWFMNRDFKAASKVYERLMQQGDSTFNTLYSAGMCYTRLDSLELAYKLFVPAFLLSGMQHAGCAYRLGVVCVDTGRLDEGIGYLDLATELLKPDTTVMKAITLAKGEAYYLSFHHAQAVEAWKEHLKYNPNSIATYYNIANATYYYLPDNKQAKSYFEKFLELARKEETPNAQLKEMMEKAETLLKKSKVR